MPPKGFNPSAALVKAMLITSAKALRVQKGVSDPSWHPPAYVYGPPSMDYGYGLIDLQSVLWFGDAVSNFRLFTTGDGATASIKQDQIHVTCFKMTGGGVPFRATLVWTDPPADPSAGVSLVNDLDLLLLSSASTAVVYGNGLTVTDMASGTRVVRDSVNNVERVAVPAGYAGAGAVLTVVVHARRVLAESSPQVCCSWCVCVCVCVFV
jgi:hypothetical protein